MQVIIMRGLPGSGKSTYAERHYPDAWVVSSDDYFHGVRELLTPENRRLALAQPYTHDPKELTYSHPQCMRLFIQALQSGDRDVVVDNTNTTVMEVSPYVLVAQAFGAPYEILEVACDPEVAANRNRHGVPFKAVLSMSQRLQDLLPPWYKVRRVHT
jgi:predicted kinase